MRGSRRSRRRYYIGGGLAGAVMIFLFATCGGPEPVTACPAPDAGSDAAQELTAAEQSAEFALVYPCTLPAAERLETASVIGESGRQSVEMAFDGPFEMTLRQSQFPPPVTPDPTGASRVRINLFPNIPASLIERNDGTRRALYHLFWEADGLYYELQAFGPPLQRSTIMEIARSLE